MKELLEKYCKFKNGLLLLNMPTGFGKTYSVIRYMFHNYCSFNSQKRKIYFITNLKKNLPLEELKQLFIDNDNYEDFEKYVLFIDSNVDSVLNNWSEIKTYIPDDFKDKEYRNLDQYINRYNNVYDESYKKEIKEKLSKELEPQFRIALKKYLTSIGVSKLNKLKDDQDLFWVGKLYPSIYIEENTIIFLSVDKFIRTNTSLLGRSIGFKDIIKDDLVFIDEFDSSKDALINNIIDTGIRHRISVISLFNNIYQGIRGRELPYEINKEKNSEQLITLQDISSKLYNELNLQSPVKSHQDLNNFSKNFLLYDYYYHTVTSNRWQLLYFVQDIERHGN
ncbi:hypothetical protein EW093_01165 [Thiospirochaeta perfilievii]|uniref:Helicase/UvrB N-terminal domain-containing protein n=1 Tax=Thiospirochaeta perfilievii TaxID=252967 RepID=A0A5C1Q8J9_9SPIO|nr:hypothetical protein [Thiospirochaeta perfilievii]QEN03370.1 hypothetical protein EW093_01165 [Thiospirochaeta perfilievii]